MSHRTPVLNALQLQITEFFQIPADITIAYRPSKTNTTALQRTCKSICSTRPLHLFLVQQSPSERSRQRHEIIRASITRMVLRSTLLRQRLHGKRPEVQRRCGKIAMAMTALRGNADFHQPVQRALNRAWLRSVARAQNRRRNSRSAIAMSSQYLTGNARYQDRACAEFESPFHSARFRGMSRNWLNGAASLDSSELDFDPVRLNRIEV